MLDVVIYAEGEAETLVATLTSLVPAVAEGVIRRGVVVDPRESHEVRRIAESAGCDFVTRADEAEVGGWLLHICAGAVLEDGWWREAAAFYERVRLVEPGRRRPAVFTYAERNYGVAPRLRELAAAALRSVPFLPASHRAVVLPPSSGIPGRIVAAMPMRITGPAETFRARIFW
jgi:hypothetical protein